jgi:hypothetical protein
MAATLASLCFCSVMSAALSLVDNIKDDRVADSS